MYFSKQSRYRNMVGGQQGSGPPPRNLTAIGVVALVLVVLCGCVGIAVGYLLNGKAIPAPNPVSSVPKTTLTADLKSTVPLKSKGLGENGLEVTVGAFQRPLQVQGQTKIAPNEQYVLVSLVIRNTKTTGDAIPFAPADFKLKGDGGLTYEANPKSVTIENLMAAQDSIAPGKTVERELIYQIAQDDSGLKLYWTAGKTTRTFQLESQ